MQHHPTTLFLLSLLLLTNCTPTEIPTATPAKIPQESPTLTAPPTAPPDFTSLQQIRNNSRQNITGKRVHIKGTAFRSELSPTWDLFAFTDDPIVFQHPESLTLSLPPLIIVYNNAEHNLGKYYRNIELQGTIGPCDNSAYPQHCIYADHITKLPT